MGGLFTVPALSVYYSLLQEGGGCDTNSGRLERFRPNLSTGFCQNSGHQSLAALECGSSPSNCLLNGHSVTVRMECSFSEIVYAADRWQTLGHAPPG